MTATVQLAFATPAELPDDDDWLSAREIAVVQGLKVAKRALDWKLGRWAAKKLARRARLRDGLDGPHAIRAGTPTAAVEILAAADGAPLLWIDGRPAACSLSISHSHRLAMAALADSAAAVGCDLERVEPRSPAFIETFLTAAEADRVALAPAGERPLIANAIWAAKEAVLKSTRDGLRKDTRAVQIEFGPAASGPPGWQRFRGRLDDSCYDGLWRQRDVWVQAIAVRADWSMTAKRNSQV